MDRAAQLERDVSFRTQDLLTANKKLREEVDRRMKVEAEVFRINEMERRRFSMDLYDTICRRLNNVSVFSKNLAAENRFFLRSSILNKLSGQIDDTIRHTRRYAHTSFPSDLITAGLRNSLETLCSETSGQSRYECQLFWTAGDASPLVQSQDIYVYWIVQEAIQNTGKHTKANRITVDVSCENSIFTVVVNDNGKGNPAINTGKSLLNESGREGLGLRSMRYWALQAGADFFINSQESGGTMVKLSITLPSKP